MDSEQKAASAEPMRLFYALWPDESVRAALTHMQDRLQGRKICSANLHMTLAFLGNQPGSVLPALKELLSALPAREVILKLDTLGCFSRQKIAWAGMRDIPAELSALHSNLTAALDHTGIEFDRRTSFKPHVTLARDARLPEGERVDQLVWHARQLVLARSVTGENGVAYEVLASRNLTDNVSN